MPFATGRVARSDIRIDRLLGTRARMGHGAVTRGADLLGVFPKIAGAELLWPRLPLLGTRGKFAVRQLDVERALHGIDLDDIAVADERDRSADRCLRSNVTDAESARRAGEASVGDEGNLVTHALAVERRRCRQHFAHAGTALGPFVPDHQHVALFISLLLHRLEAGLLAVETTRRTGETQHFHTGNLNDGAVRGE